MGIKTCSNCKCHTICSKRMALNSTINNFTLSIQMPTSHIKSFKTGQYLLLATNCEYYIPYEEETEDGKE